MTMHNRQPGTRWANSVSGQSRQAGRLPTPKGCMGPKAVPLRPPDEVMRLERFGAAFPTRLSFMRTLLRRLRQEAWSFVRSQWHVDANGVGHAVYTVSGPTRAYSLIAFAHDLPDDMRSDRVIATAWDATFALFDGVPTDGDISRLAANVPKQEAGRVCDSELVLSRANRSARLWDHVVESLARGEQPDADQVRGIGYLMRTTAVYGSGKFGAADRSKVAARSLMGGPFAIEMLTVWLIRSFSLDLVEHMARVKGGAQATTLAPDLRRDLGIGNSTGLGMAPFLLRHPTLLDAWMTVRETALARVRGQAIATHDEQDTFRTCLVAAQTNAATWTSNDARQSERIVLLCDDLKAIEEQVARGALDDSQPWDRLYRWGCETLSVEGQEQLTALILEPHGALIDDLADRMAVDETKAFLIDGSTTVGELRQQIDADYAWALVRDYTDASASQRFWYVSEEKLEPRLGERYAEPGADLEMPLAVGRSVKDLRAGLETYEADVTLTEFLVAHPEHRHVVRRVQINRAYPYSEVQDNLIDASMVPVDLLRLKLSFFGATQFDPRSDRWLRIAMYRGAPFPDVLSSQGSAAQDLSGEALLAWS